MEQLEPFTLAPWARRHSAKASIIGQRITRTDSRLELYAKPDTALGVGELFKGLNIGT